MEKIFGIRLLKCSEPVRKDENLADQESLAFKETPQVTSPNYVKVEFTREF